MLNLKNVFKNGIEIDADYVIVRGIEVRNAPGAWNYNKKEQARHSNRTMPYHILGKDGRTAYLWQL